MLRRCFIFRVTVHSPRAIPFAISADSAVSALRAKYESRWLMGANSAYIDFKAPAAEFMPFFLCSGKVGGEYVGTVEYTRTGTGTDGKMKTTTTRTTTQLLTLNTTFHENQTQIYGGYKYNNKHIYTVLKNEENPILMQKVADVDLSVAAVNLFEMSVTTLNMVLRDSLLKFAEELAIAEVRRYHLNASSVSVSFRSFHIQLNDVFPTFVPCFVIPAEYDGNSYTMYVSGATGICGGPYLINSLAAARLGAVTTVAVALLLSPNKVMAVMSGSVAAVAVYYAVFFATRAYPAYRRDQSRRAREADKAKYVEEDVGGFRPSVDSQRRVTEEYHRSTFWSDHRYEQKTSPTADNIQDKKGYYKMLGLAGNESVNEVRSAYRKQVLSHHPDAGGSTAKMTALNEAYRVLRDPVLRGKYNRGEL
jgi:hypothetical protein